MAERKPPKPKKPKTARWQRIAMMDKEIVDVEGAATLLGVSTTTIYNLARKGEIPATRVGREWRFARANLIQWVAWQRRRSTQRGVKPRTGDKEKVVSYERFRRCTRAILGRNPVLVISGRDVSHVLRLLTHC